MSDTTAHEQRSVESMADFSRLDECDSEGYAPSESAWDSGSFAWDYLDRSSRPVAAMVLSSEDGTPMAFMGDRGFPFLLTGSDVTVFVPAGGFIRVTQDH